MMCHAGNYATVAKKLRRVRVVVASRRNKEYIVSSALEKEQNHIEFSPTSKTNGRGAQHIR
jgi:phosphosulfolactate phosphohydrolase-like enzyme